MTTQTLEHTFSHSDGYIEALLKGNHLYVTYSIAGSSDDVILEDSCGEQIDVETSKTWIGLSEKEEETAKNKYAEKIGVAAYNRHYSHVAN